LFCLSLIVTITYNNILYSPVVLKTVKYRHCVIRKQLKPRRRGGGRKIIRKYSNPATAWHDTRRRRGRMRGNLALPYGFLIWQHLPTVAAPAPRHKRASVPRKIYRTDYSSGFPPAQITGSSDHSAPSGSRRIPPRRPPPRNPHNECARTPWLH